MIVFKTNQDYEKEELYETLLQELSTQLIKIDQRSFGDHLIKLLTKQVRNKSDEERAFRIAPEQTDLDALLQEDGWIKNGSDLNVQQVI